MVVLLLRERTFISQSELNTIDFAGTARGIAGSGLLASYKLAPQKLTAIILKDSFRFPTLAR